MSGFSKSCAFAQVVVTLQRQDIPRTWDKILDTLAALNSQDLLPDLSFIANFDKRRDATDPMKDGWDDGSEVVK